MNTEPLPFRKGDIIGQKYEVIDLLGEGGFGLVYLAFISPDHPFYALKTFKGAYSTEKTVKDRFRKEAQVWINLEKHPHIVRAYFVDEIFDRLFIAMEWIAPEKEGGPNSLEAYLRYYPPDLSQALQWAIQFCHGIEYAYSKGIRAHRDIKPANIMIDHNKNVKITDFGLADVFGSMNTTSDIKFNIRKGKVGLSFQTMDGTGFGTPTHMPPEQFINASKCDEKSDIYSFGIVLYQMVARGNLPFLAPLPKNEAYEESRRFWLETYRLHCQAPIPYLNSPLFSVIERCLEKDTKRRYQTFKDLRTDLEILYKSLTGGVVRLPEKEDLDAWEWNNKGISLNNLKRYQEAIVCFDKAIDIDPLNSSAWNNMGTSLRLLSKQKEALSCYEKALKINPSNAHALFNKGSLLSELGQRDDAIQCFNRALEIRPVNPYLISQIGGMLSISKYMPAEIRAICQKIVTLQLKPYDIDGLYNLGLCYLQIEDIDNALKIFHEAERVNEHDNGVWFELMNIYFRKQNAEKVIYYADKLIDSNNELEEAVNKKSRVLFYTGNANEAVSLLTATLKSHPGWDFLWFALSEIYEQAGLYRSLSLSL